MINIVLPIAGRGSRFAEAGFELPKPLISVHGKPMIEVVVNNVRPQTEHRFVFVALKEHLDHLGMRSTLERIAPNCVIVPVEQVTQGAACTVLLAKDYINNDNHLMIANSDQYVDIDINDYLSKLEAEEVDGLIMTMNANDPKWSFVGISDNGYVDNVVEKEVISNEATVGIYNFKKGSDFVSAAERMILRDLRVNNEFYVAPTYNELILNGSKISFYNIGEENRGMYGLGIPSDLKHFCELEVSLKATKN
jgi:NDP-sugar pyrophosphorylase family protein